MLLLLVSLFNVAVFFAVADFPTACSGSPTADNIHDVPIVPAAISSLILTVSLLWLWLASRHADFTTLQATLLLLASIVCCWSCCCFHSCCCLRSCCCKQSWYFCHPCCYCCWRYCCCLCHHRCLHPVCGRHSCCCWRPFSSWWCPCYYWGSWCCWRFCRSFRTCFFWHPAVTGFSAIDGVLLVADRLILASLF